jgi:hypothetical protein
MCMPEWRYYSLRAGTFTLCVICLTCYFSSIFVSTAQYTYQLVISSFVSVKSEHTLRNNGGDGNGIVRVNLRPLINICARARFSLPVHVFQDEILLQWHN